MTVRDDWDSLIAFLEEINESNSTNYKVDILSKYKDNEFIKKILLYTYHPYMQYGVTSKNLKKHPELTEEECFASVFDLLDALNNRTITGNAAIAATNAFIQDHKNVADIVYQIIDRNIETRATTTLINKVIPDLIPTFDVALAFDATKVKGIDLLDGSWYVSRKLDGIRCLAIIGEGTVKFFSRNGKEFHTLDKVKEEIINLGIKNCVLDGEICLMKEDGSDDFQGILKQIQRKNHTIENPKFWVFDVLTTEEFETCKGTEKLSSRYLRPVTNVFKSSSILKLLPQIHITDEDILVSIKDMSKSKGWEGLIVRKNVGYEGKRTRNMLKLKEFYDAEYLVEDVIMEPQRVIVEGQEVVEDVLSAVIVTHKGGRVKVGSGFSLDERRKYFKDPSGILGSIITVQYFEETVDQDGNNSLRFPVFKANHGKKREV